MKCVTRRSCGGVLAAAGLMLALNLGGCEAAPGLDKQFGFYYENLPAPPAAVEHAIDRTLPQMNLMLVERKAGQVVAVAPHNAKVTIRYSELGPAGNTRLGVKVESGESETFSNAVIKRIKSNLP